MKGYMEDEGNSAFEGRRRGELGLTRNHSSCKFFLSTRTMIRCPSSWSCCGLIGHPLRLSQSLLSADIEDTCTGCRPRPRRQTRKCPSIVLEKINSRLKI